MNNSIDTVTVGATTANIYQDMDDRGPEEWADEGLFLVGFHRDFSVQRDGYGVEIVRALFDKDEITEDNRDEVKRIKRQYHIFGLEAYIHSGVCLALSNEGNFVDRQWDVSRLGAVFVSKNEWNTKIKARKAALGLIETWNQSLSGDVYGYSIEGADSCWGFYGMDAVKEAAKEACECAEAQRIEAHIKRKKVEITRHVPLEKRTTLVLSR